MSGSAPALVVRRARLAAGEAPVDVRIANGRIAAIGSVLTPDGEVLDAEERLLLPGLWDEHVHMTQWALASIRLPLAGAASAAAAAELVRRAAAAEPSPSPLIGAGFQDGVWPDAPTGALLDAAAGDRPVVLQSHDLHCVWLNAAAARLFGIEVDASGLLREAPAFALNQRVNALEAAGVDDAVLRAARIAAAAGVVGIVDLEMAWPGEWRRRAAAGFDALRVEAGVYPADLERAVAEGLSTGSRLGAELIRIGPLKILIDGALNTRTAFCAEPYPDGSRGLLTVPPDDLVALLRRGAAAGFAPVVHAIGDAAVADALDAFATTGLHGRIEHAQLVADADLPRFGALGVTASVQPAHLLDDRAVAERHWPGRTGRAYPLRALLDAGATLALGSDAPVAPLDPWLAIRAAVERADAGEPPWHPEQRITPAEALAASTRGRTRIAAGDVADLVLVESPVERMRPADVAATLVAGRFTHRRG